MKTSRHRLRSALWLASPLALLSQPAEATPLTRTNTQAQAAPGTPTLIELNQAGARLGKRLAAVGDMNGDGYADLAATSLGTDNGDSTRTEYIHLFLGSAEGLVSPPAWTYSVQNLSTSYDLRLAAIGDINDDGYSDLLVGAPNHPGENGDDNNGSVLLFLGGSGGPASTPDFQVISGSKGAQLGSSVAGLGDINGDGIADFGYGAPYAESGTSTANEGIIYLHFGNSTLPTTPAWSGESNQSGGRLGCGLSRAGDVNGDGYDDILAGACFYDNPETDEGQIRIYFGNSNKPGVSPDWVADGDTANLFAGAVIASAGDFNADGYDDVLFGVTGSSEQQTNSGLVRAYFGSASGPETTPSWTFSYYQKDSGWAESLVGGIDLSGDGIDDLLMGASLYDSGNLKDAGRVALFEGAARLLPQQPTWTLDGSVSGALFGASLARVGDVSGDGCGELVVGSPGITNPESGEGQLLVYTADGKDRDGDAYCQGDSPFADCNDENAAAYPGAVEAPGNGVDENCDGQELCYLDGDLDGYYDPAIPPVLSSDLTCSSSGLLPASTGPSDCDDTRANVSPATPEVCDALDNDCDTLIDEGVTLIFYADSDGDSYGDINLSREDCAAPIGYVANADDCNDSEAAINPGATEQPADGQDQNCDLLELCYADADDDGFRPEVTDVVTSNDLDCDDPGEAIATDPAGDCDDTLNTFNPLVLETCDGLDNNCDDQLDNGTAVDCPTGDFDEDGFTEQAGDCNDQSPEMKPDAVEICDQLDNDCNQVVDDGDVCATPTPSDDAGGCACRTDNAAVPSAHPSAHPSASPWALTGLLLLGLFGMRRRR